MKIRKWKDFFIAEIRPNGEQAQLLRGMPGYSKWRNGNLIIANTTANIDYLLENFGDIALWDFECQEILNQHKIERKKAAELAALKRDDNIDLTIDDYTFKNKPYDHQLKAFKLSRDKEKFALFLEMGLGKTYIAINNVRYLYDKGEIDSCVVIAPNNVHRNWIEKEIPEHCPGEYQAAFNSSQMVKKQRDKFQRVCESDVLKFVAFNIEGFSRKGKQRETFERFLANHDPIIIVDESSRIKTPGSKRTKYLINATKNIRYKHILTGTPVTKGMEDLFSQFLFLSPKIIGYTSFFTFRNRYCRMGGFEGRQIVGYMNCEELIGKIDGYSLRMTKAECLDLPDKIFKHWNYDLSAKKREIYNSMAKQYIAELGDIEVSAPLGIVRAMRLHQISCGWFGVDDEWTDSKAIEEKNERIECLKEVLTECDDCPGKTIIWAKFQKDIDEIEKLLGDKAVSLHGRVSGDDKAEAIRRFQNDDEIQYLVGNPRSGGIGVTLTAADNAIYYSYDEDLDVMLQSLDRNHRIDAKRNKDRKHVVYHFIQARKTVDQKFAKSLKYKKSVANYVTGDPEDLFLGE